MTSPNLALVQGVYDGFARGDIAAIIAPMAADIVWLEAENFPYADGNPYVGPNAVVAGVFGRIGGDWDGFHVVIDDLLDAGDRIVMLGRYKGTSKATGKPINAQVVHAWTLVAGEITRFQQYVDTLQIVQALA